MSQEERSVADQKWRELMKFLEETPETVRQLTAGLSEENLKWKPSADEFSALEQVCHLRDLEVEGYSLRIRRLLTESRPALPDFDGGRLARERRYQSQKFETAIEDFARARKENTDLVAALSPEQLSLSGTLAGVGEMTLGRLLGLMREHDRSHREELRELRGRMPQQG